VLIRGAEGVQVQSRSGNIVTPVWLDVAVPAMALRPGTTLDGELVIWRHDRLDFGAVQSRAASSPARARQLAAELPASYAVWDVLSHPELGNVQPRPYLERRGLLLDLLAELGPPIQAVPATDDRATALDWYESLRPLNIEGIVAKRANSAYRPGRIWVKVRHTHLVDAVVIGYTGPRSRPRALVVRLPGGRRAVSQRLPAALAAQAAALLQDSGALTGGTVDGERYSPAAAGLVAEVLAGSTRHRVATVTRVRPAETDLQSDT
jgi:ATP-dependent DNA ligase